jgi:4-amino-4-deoxy-L-arabinose transferase-like glycosyltransferase
VGLILILALGLRTYRLDVQSLWNDEGNAARAAERPVPLILEAAEGDIHPPGYYLLLHAWRAAAGESEFALRALSALCGVLTVALTCALGRRLGDGWMGWGAGLLAALSPLAVYYSQEARMYALLGFVSTASTFLLLQLEQDLPRGRFHGLLPAAYVLSVGAGLYIHYAFPFVLIVHNLLFLGRWVWRRPAWRPLLAWAGLQAAALVLFLPWLPIALQAVTGWPSAGGEYELGPALLDVLRVLTVGITLEQQAARGVLVVTGILLAMGFLPGCTPVWGRVTNAENAESAKGAEKDLRVLCALRALGDKKPKGRLAHTYVALILAAWLFVLVGLIFAFDLYKPAYLKFLVAVLPPFQLLIARGVENAASLLRRPAGPLLRLGLYTLLGLLLLPSLSNLYFDPTYARNDYRQIAADVAAVARPGDGILLNAANQWEVFTYYHREGAPVYPIPRSRPPRPAEVEAELEDIAANHRRLIVLYWGDAESDPQRLVESWLAEHAYKAGDRWYGEVRVAVYGLAPVPGEPAVELDARLGPSIRLRGYTLGEGPFAPGEILPVSLFWETDVPLSSRYKVFLHLSDGASPPVAQIDTEPGDGLLPTTIWPGDTMLVDRYGVLLPAGLPPGEYTLLVGLYDIASGERLTVTLDGSPAGDRLLLDVIPVRVRK